MPVNLKVCIDGYGEVYRTLSPCVPRVGDYVSYHYGQAIVYRIRWDFEEANTFAVIYCRGAD